MKSKNGDLSNKVILMCIFSFFRCDSDSYGVNYNSYTLYIPVTGAVALGKKREKFG